MLLDIVHYIFSESSYSYILQFFQALSLSDSKDQPVFYKNRAAVYLKIDDFENVIKDCTKCKSFLFFIENYTDYFIRIKDCFLFNFS